MPTVRLERAILSDAEVLWDYHRLGAMCGKADVILGLGSYDLSVAEHAAHLFLEARAPWLFFAGGLVPRTDLLRTPWDRAEAVVFGERAREIGVPEDRLVLETASMNTGENFRFALKTMRERSIDCRDILVVTKPNMERRARATALVNLPPSMNVMVTSSPITFDRYCRSINPEKLIGLMVGDLQRIALYPAMGFQAREFIPPDVDASYRRLVQAGFTDHLIADPSFPESSP